MKVRPLNDFRMLGSGISVSKDKVYDAIYATNQPNWQERGLIFIQGAEGDTSDIGFLLDQTDYVVEILGGWENDDTNPNSIKTNEEKGDD